MHSCSKMLKSSHQFSLEEVLIGRLLQIPKVVHLLLPGCGIWLVPVFEHPSFHPLECSWHATGCEHPLHAGSQISQMGYAA